MVSVRWALGSILCLDCREVSPIMQHSSCCCFFWNVVKRLCELTYCVNSFLSRALALPPPPALDEEAPANYFNLDPSSSPAVMNIALPPPPGINPPPPGKTALSSCHIYNMPAMLDKHLLQRRISLLFFFHLFFPFMYCSHIVLICVVISIMQTFRLLCNLVVYDDRVTPLLPSWC